MGQQGVITVLTAAMTRDFYFYWPRWTTTCVRVGVGVPASRFNRIPVSVGADIVSALFFHCLAPVKISLSPPSSSKSNSESFDGNLLIFNKPRREFWSSLSSELFIVWVASMWAHSLLPIDDATDPISVCGSFHLRIYLLLQMIYILFLPKPQRIRQPGSSSLWSNRFVYVEQAICSFDSERKYLEHYVLGLEF